MIIALIICAIEFCVDGLIEYNNIKNEISIFKSRGEIVFIDEERKYYYYEISSNETSRTFDYKWLYDEEKDNDYFGDIGDITITNRNPLREYPFSEFVGVVAKYFYCGHATINIDNGSLIESEGKEDKVVREKESFWLQDESFNEVIGLKVNVSTERKLQAVNNAKTKLGLKYNWFFPISFKDSYYCTDLITSCYKDIINLNSDLFITTGNDLIDNKNTYIYYFQEKVYNNGCLETHIYYLKNK